VPFRKSRKKRGQRCPFWPSFTGAWKKPKKRERVTQLPGVKTPPPKFTPPVGAKPGAKKRAQKRPGEEKQKRKLERGKKKPPGPLRRVGTPIGGLKRKEAAPKKMPSQKRDSEKKFGKLGPNPLKGGPQKRFSNQGNIPLPGKKLLGPLKKKRWEKRFTRKLMWPKKGPSLFLKPGKPPEKKGGTPKGVKIGKEKGERTGREILGAKLGGKRTLLLILKTF